MKINLANELLETWLYDRDNGDGAALKAIQKHYPDAVAFIEEVKENKVVFENLEYTKVNKEQAEGRAFGRRKFVKKNKKQNRPKIQYHKGFFTVDGEVRKGIKRQK